MTNWEKGVLTISLEKITETELEGGQRYVTLDNGFQFGVTDEEFADITSKTADGSLIAISDSVSINPKEVSHIEEDAIVMKNKHRYTVTDKTILNTIKTLMEKGVAIETQLQQQAQTFATNEVARDAKVDEKVGAITELQDKAFNGYYERDNVNNYTKIGIYIRKDKGQQAPMLLFVGKENSIIYQTEFYWNASGTNLRLRHRNEDGTWSSWDNIGTKITSSYGYKKQVCKSVNKSTDSNGMDLYKTISFKAGNTYFFFVKSNEDLEFNTAWINISLDAKSKRGSIYINSKDLKEGIWISQKATADATGRLYMSMYGGKEGIQVETTYFSCTNNDITSAVGAMYEKYNEESNEKYGYTGDKIELNSFSYKSAYFLNVSHQCIGYSNKYIVALAAGLSHIYFLNTDTEEIEFDCKDLNIGDGGDVYHCNCGGFSDIYYNEGDYFPLFYVSQRNLKTGDDIGRGFIQFIRFIPQFDMKGKITSVSASVVHTIYMPAMTRENSMGTPNCSIFGGKIYVSSRNNKSTDDNYDDVKISSFNLPEIKGGATYFNDTDILESFYIDKKATDTQSCMTHNNKMYCLRGGNTANPANLYVVDLERKKIVTDINLKECNFVGEPEGIYINNGELYVSVNERNVVKFLF